MGFKIVCEGAINISLLTNVQMPWGLPGAGGRMLKFRIDRSINLHNDF